MYIGAQDYADVFMHEAKLNAEQMKLHTSFWNSGMLLGDVCK